jgi:hypothetical protein
MTSAADQVSMANLFSAYTQILNHLQTQSHLSSSTSVSTPSPSASHYFHLARTSSSSNQHINTHLLKHPRHSAEHNHKSYCVH